MASIAELDETVRAARQAGCKDLVLLKCTSTYTATPANSNVRTIAHLRELFGCEVGLSDHSMGVGVSVAAVALGATGVTEHVTIDRRAGGRRGIVEGQRESISVGLGGGRILKTTN